MTTSRGEQTTPERSDDFVYDAVGNTVLRRTDGKEQTLDWDTEGHLAKVTENGRTTSYVYDAGGARLIRKDAEGSTLYLPGGNELLLKPDGTTKVGTRYYTHSGETTAVRTGGKLSYLFSDHHDTATTAVDAATQAVNRRKLTVFGAQRGAAATEWPGDRGFIGGTKDNSTGLTHLGAREYDPATARFISVDPLMDVTDPQQLHGYSYGNNNPLLYSDPDGKWWGSELVNWFFDEVDDFVNNAVAIYKEYHAPRAVRPRASNQRLNNYLGNIYARDNAKKVYGDGKASSAIKYELRNGHRLMVDGMEKDQWHVQKGWAILSGLSELIDGDRAAREGAKGKNAVRLSDEDLAIAKREAQELWEALNSRDVTGNVAKDIKTKPQLEKEMRGNREKVVNSAGMQDVTGRRFERNKYNGRPEPVGEPTKMRGFARTFGVVGGVAQVPGYARDVQRHGFKQATKDLIKGLTDPFGIAKRANTPSGSGCPC
ncbi:RHS repeat-associated core domain-containing protein [Streptomyces cinnamoneus]|uniref:RHS repeat domain-containing protein n=1 Tax=Streptomyces cinnamoneus TaxID=53446 RepID=UPI0034410878